VAHPFFDAMQFPLGRAEAGPFHVALSTAVSQYARIEILYRQCGDNLPPLRQDSADAVWLQALDQLTVARCLVRLIERILADAALAAMHDTARAIRDADAFQDVALIGDRQVFIDRERLRAHLGKLGTRDSLVRAVLVRGDGESGKSWTARLIEHVANQLGDLCVMFDENTVSTVVEVIDKLFSAYAGSGKIPQYETGAAYYRKVCNRLLELAASSKQRCWIVADDLGTRSDGPRLDREVKDFFDQFMYQLSDPAIGKWFRLILIDYPDTAQPTNWKEWVWTEDRTSSGDIDAAKIAEYLERWGAARGKRLTPVEYKQLAVEIVAKVERELAAARPGVAPATRLQLIHDEVRATVERLAGGAA
jgi:hypothetical protein